MSALIVTFSHGRYVAEAIRSALAQSPALDEVVVVDDGSPDDTVDRVRELSDPRIRLIAEAHRGIARLAETYNVGLEACRGSLVALLEGDDRWPAGKLGRQVPVFNDPEIVLSHGRYSVIGARGTPLHPGVAPPIWIPEGRYDPLPYVLRASYLMPVTVIARREALIAAGGLQQLPGSAHSDYPTFLALAELGAFHYQSVAVGEWRRHGRSAIYRLAGSELAGAEEALGLALRARERIGDRSPWGSSLPDRDGIRRAWADAAAHAVWQICRVLLLERRFSEARRIVLPALCRQASFALRLRLAAAAIASLLRVDLEGAARLRGGSSVLAELD